MPRATWNGTVLAESNDCIAVEGNQYFPPSAVHREHLRASDTHTVCGWKGTASYYDVVVGDQVNKDAAKQIKDYIAFWHGVTVEP